MSIAMNSGYTKSRRPRAPLEVPLAFFVEVGQTRLTWPDARGSWCWWSVGSGRSTWRWHSIESAWQKPHSSRHLSRVWQALGFGWCGVATSVCVRLEALCLLLQHGAWVREPLSVHCCVVACHLRGSRSSRACVSSSEWVLGWQGTRLAVKPSKTGHLITKVCAHCSCTIPRCPRLRSPHVHHERAALKPHSSRLQDGGFNFL